MIHPIVTRLLESPYGHTIFRDEAGNSHVRLMGSGKREVLIVAPTFEEACERALNAMDAMPEAK